MKKTEIIILACIIAAAFVMRVYDSNLAVFDRETTIPLQADIGMLESGKPILAGFGGTLGNEITLGPAAYYLLLIPVAISHSVLVSTFFVALLNVLAVILCYFFVKRIWGANAAIASAALFATAPWAIFYSRFIWNTNFIPLFAILFFYGFYMTLQKDSRGIVISMAAFAVMIQLHLSALLSGVFLIWSLYTHFKSAEKGTKQILAGLIIAALVLSPAIYLNVKNDFSNAANVLGHTNQPKNPDIFTAVSESAGIPVLMATGYYGKYILGNLALPPWMNYAEMIFAGIVIALMSLGFLNIAKKFRKPQNAMLSAWLIIPVLFFIFKNQNVSPHYFLIIFPAQFIVLGILFAKFMKSEKFKAAAIAVLVLILAANITSFSYALHLVKENNGTNGAWGVTYQNKLDVVDFVISDAETKPIDIVFYRTDGLDYKYLFEYRKADINYEVVNSLEELESKNGAYLIMDSYSATVGLNVAKLSDAEKDHLQGLNSRTIGNIKIAKI